MSCRRFRRSKTVGGGQCAARPPAQSCRKFGCEWADCSALVNEEEGGSKMQKLSALFLALFSLCCLADFSFGQSAPANTEVTSLCSLQSTVAEGKHKTVRVSGVYGPSLNYTVLEDPACPNETTWVELGLRTNRNRAKLRRMLDHSRRAYVELDGEFYGPPVPDPKLPESIRKSYHPGWGHLAAFRTKLIVHAIRAVEAAPTKSTTIDLLPNRLNQLVSSSGQ